MNRYKMRQLKEAIGGNFYQSHVTGTPYLVTAGPTFMGSVARFIPHHTAIGLLRLFTNFSAGHSKNFFDWLENVITVHVGG
jgi:hypothetical protein